MSSPPPPLTHKFFKSHSIDDIKHGCRLDDDIRLLITQVECGELHRADVRFDRRGGEEGGVGRGRGVGVVETL